MSEQDTNGIDATRTSRSDSEPMETDAVPEKRLRRRPSLTRAVMAGLFHMRFSKGAVEVLAYQLGPSGRATRGIDRKTYADLRRAEKWIEDLVSFEEQRRPGLQRRIGR